jgi:hypothetical protein
MLRKINVKQGYKEPYGDWHEMEGGQFTATIFISWALFIAGYNLFIKKTTTLIHKNSVLYEDSGYKSDEWPQLLVCKPA